VSFKTELKLNNKQKTLLAKHAGVARHAYNWGLATCFQALEKGEKLPSAIDLHKKLVTEVKSVYSWYYEVSKCSPLEYKTEQVTIVYILPLSFVLCPLSFAILSGYFS
jgi:putative transposase